MATIAMIREEDADEEIRGIYDEIKSCLGIDFVPNMYKVMAHKPGYLKSTWEKTKAIMHEPGKLDKLTREIVAVVDLFSGFNKLLFGLQVEMDEKAWHG